MSPARWKVVGLVVMSLGCGSSEPPPKTVAELMEMLQDPDQGVQVEAAGLLAQLGPKAAEAVPALVQALRSKHSLVRQGSAVALGEIGPEAKDAVPALAAALRDSEYIVRKAAADALGKIGPAAMSAIPALEQSGKEPDPCKSVEAALKKIRS